MLEFGELETILVRELRAGDFVVSIPAQNGVRGAHPNSGVRSIREDYGETWTQRWGRRKINVLSRELEFNDRSVAALNYPCEFQVQVRRPVGGAQ